MNKKLIFETVGQFISALEEGPLFDESGVEYVINKEEFCLCLIRSNKLIQKDYSLSRIWFSTIDCNRLKYFTRQKPISDKDLVRCWDNGWDCKRDIRFYDAISGGTFSGSGPRNYSKYDHYEVIEPNSEGIYEYPFEWANEAKKKLED